MRTYTDEEIERGRRKLRRFYDFKDVHGGRGGAWAYIENRAADLHAKKLRISGRALLEEVRHGADNFTGRNGEKCEINNDYAAVIARELIAEHPEYKEHTELRQSVFDVLMCETEEN